MCDMNSADELFRLFICISGTTFVTKVAGCEALLSWLFFMVFWGGTCWGGYVVGKRK
jgi:hypothetical protein